jgi:aspartate 1-decarboxylase
MKALSRPRSQRIQTYALPAPRGSGQVIINGAAARHFCAGDKVIVAAFLLTDERVAPKMLLVDSANHFAGWLTDNSPIIGIKHGELTNR